MLFSLLEAQRSDASLFIIVIVSFIVVSHVSCVLTGKHLLFYNTLFYLPLSVFLFVCLATFTCFALKALTHSALPFPAGCGVDDVSLRPNLLGLHARKFCKHTTVTNNVQRFILYNTLYLNDTSASSFQM